MSQSASPPADTERPHRPYRGRFAPSPTGPLHFGSLLTAVASYLQARAQGGQWLVRIEDVDQTRARPGAAADILRTLASFGFEWDGPVCYQHDRTERYRAALDRLRQQDLAYPCSCSRTELLAMQAPPSQDGEELVYAGHCRQGPQHPERAMAYRLRVPSPAMVEFADAAQGPQRVDVAASSGDFVIRRRDGLFAYQLAVVVDDAEQGITEVVRGCDLLSSTPRQILLQRALALPTPHYLHVPIVVTPSGKKLSKTDAAPAVTAAHAGPTLYAVLVQLGQTPPEDLQRQTVDALWDWAIAHWSPQRLLGRQHVVLTPANLSD